MSLGVMSVALCNRRRPVDFRYALFATEVVRRCNMSKGNSGLMQRNKFVLFATSLPRLSIGSATQQLRRR